MPRIKLDANYQYNVHYACPSCGRQLKSPIKHIEKQVQCPGCGLKFPIPGKEELNRMVDKGDPALGKAGEERSTARAVSKAVDKPVRLLFAGLVFLGTLLAISTGAFSDIALWFARPVAAVFGAKIGALVGSVAIAVVVVLIFSYCSRLARGRK